MHPFALLTLSPDSRTFPDPSPTSLLVDSILSYHNKGKIAKNASGFIEFLSSLNNSLNAYWLLKCPTGSQTHFHRLWTLNMIADSIWFRASSTRHPSPLRSIFSPEGGRNSLSHSSSDTVLRFCSSVSSAKRTCKSIMTVSFPLVCWIDFIRSHSHNNQTSFQAAFQGESRRATDWHQRSNPVTREETLFTTDFWGNSTVYSRNTHQRKLTFEIIIMILLLRKCSVTNICIIHERWSKIDFYIFGRKKGCSLTQNSLP